MKEKMKSFFDAILKPALIGFVAIVVIMTVLSIPTLAGTVAGIAAAWAFGKLIMFGYALYKEDFND